MGRNISAYVDDVVVRSKKEDHIQDLRKTFANLRRHVLKLNPEKCVFGVRRGKLLGCMVTERGIEANPEKIEAIRRMKPPTTRKGVQKLTGRLASLNRFISKSAEKCLPFFKALKGSGNLEWAKSRQRPSKRGLHLQQNDQDCTGGPTRKKYLRICRRRGGQKQEEGRPHSRSSRNIRKLSPTWTEAEPREVRLRRPKRQAARLHDH